MKREKHDSKPRGSARAAPAESRPPAAQEELLHELRQHQFELEIQNDELRVAMSHLEAARAQYSHLYNSAPVGYLSLTEKGLILEANRTAVQLLGVDQSQLIQQPLTQFIFSEDQDVYYQYRRLLFDSGTEHGCELRMLKNGAPFWVQLEGRTERDAEGASIGRVVISDITPRKQTQIRERLARDVMTRLNSIEASTDTIRDIMDMIKTSMGFEVVGIRLRAGDDYPYFSHDGLTEDFLQTENSVVARREDGEPCRDKDGHISLECTCGVVLSGQTDPTNTLFTDGGSFWTNDSRSLLDLPADQDPRINPRNRCVHEGFLSMALIPLRADGEPIGLLQLNDHRPNQFTLEMIEFFEGLGASIGVALSRKRLHAKIEDQSKFPSENQNQVLRIADDGTLLYANPAALSQLAEWHLECGQAAPAMLQEIVTQSKQSGSHQEAELDYKGRVYAFCVGPVFESGYTNLYGRDITVRKLAEEALLREHALLLAQANSTMEGILIVDNEGKQTFQNRRMVELWKIPPPIADNDDDQAQVQYVMSKTAHPEQFAERVQYLYAHPDETSRDEVELTDGTVLDRYSAPVLGSNGENYGRIWTFADITERKLAEATLQETNERLKKSLDQLKRSQETIIQQERLAALGQMAGGIAHDFNNVLMPIIGFSELLTSVPAVLDDREKTLHMLEMILSAGRDARQVVRRLRTVYKQDDIEHCLVDLAKIVESAASLTMPKWKEEMSAAGVDIDIVTDIQSSLPIKGNAGELRELLMNTIINATHAMPQGGTITFRISCEDGAFVVLEVQDTGTGMNEATLRHCLEPFYTTKGAEGSGLGLAMAHGTVKRHSGTLDIESSPGAGTTIRMRFPVHCGEAGTATEEEHAPADIPPLRILIIDDEARVRHILEAMLETDGHYLELAESGQEGLAHLREEAFDLVITDRAMPQMGGDEVAFEVQSLRPGTPVIMLTGFGDIMNDAQELPLGVSCIMAKPVTPQELQRTIASVIPSQIVHPSRRP